MLDYLVVNGRLLDPESGQDFHGSLGIAGDRIAGLYQAYPPSSPKPSG